MKSETLLSILLGILILVSAVQAYQLVNMKSATSSGTSAAASAQAQYSSGAGGGNAASTQAAPSGLASAPNMVGGC